MGLLALVLTKSSHGFNPSQLLDKAPKAVENFLAYSRNEYYSNTIFH